MKVFIPSLDQFVRKDHPYRQILELVDFKELTHELEDCYSDIGRGGYPVDTAFKCLLLQYAEDLSDRELERFLEENVAGKLFCGFGLGDKTPDFSYFSVLRKRIGIEKLANLFNRVRDSLKSAGLIREIFTFVDATKLVSKMSTWADRDKAIKEGLEKFNNATAARIAKDKEARFGCKGKDKFWYGYKKHVSVDMKHGLIGKVIVTPANVPDHKGLKDVCPDGGMVFGDKGYSPNESRNELIKKGCHSGIILKNNMKGKNRDKDRWLTKVRMPYEGVFSKGSGRARYCGVIKNQFQAIMESLAFNFKRLARIASPPLVLCPIKA